jgi:hypothetical protein
MPQRGGGRLTTSPDEGPDKVTQLAAPGAERPLRWPTVPLAALAVMLADVLVGLAPYVARGGRPGAGLGAISPLFFAMPFFFGLTLGALLALADRRPRGWPRPLRWALAAGLAGLLFSPDGAVYFANAFAFGGDLALQALKAMWPMAIGYACLGYCLAWALGRSGRPFGLLALTGLLAGAGSCVIWLVLARSNLGLANLAAVPLPGAGTLLLNLGRWSLEGVLLGLALALGAARTGRAEPDPQQSRG